MISDTPKIYRFNLMGEMPSKKNAWKRGADGHVYIPIGVKKEIDDFLWQIKGTRNRPTEPIAEPIEVHIDFLVKDGNKDLDNMVTTTLDILQASGVIKNDKYVRSLVASKVRSDNPRIIINIR